MTAFLRDLEVRIADRFSISPDKALGRFDVVPYSAKHLEGAGLTDDVSEDHAELQGEDLAVFQYRLNSLGARHAYSLGKNAYLVIDKGAMPILEEMARVIKAPREERRAFITNPRAFITEAVNRHLTATGKLEGLDDAQQAEMVESIAGPSLIETREYSERVTGVVVYRRSSDMGEGSGTTWLPEAFAAHLVEAIRSLPDPELLALRDHMAAVVASGDESTAVIAGEKVQVTHSRLAALEGEIQRRDSLATAEKPPTEAEDGVNGPIILETKENFAELTWEAKLSPRVPAIPVSLPARIKTPLRAHQVASFDWTIAAWQAGLPGILNADEQGLGKTLQTISFLVWLKDHMKQATAANRGPILVVAPTSLLRNWEQEVETHVEGPGFGTLVRLYGSALGANKQRDARGTETQSGLPQLDMNWLDEAFEDGRAHRYWVLTTYTTLANYQHSLGKIPFSALVMDEIQNIKNRATLASKAVEAMNADFRIGLTGTPIENAAIDLWTIMDRIAPGCLGSGAEFKARYASPDVENIIFLGSRARRAVADDLTIQISPMECDHWAL